MIAIELRQCRDNCRFRPVVPSRVASGIRRTSVSRRRLPFRRRRTTKIRRVRSAAVAGRRSRRCGRRRQDSERKE